MLLPQVKVKVKQYLTRREQQPVPMRTMVGYVREERPRSLYLVLHGQPAPSDECLHCGRTLTHPVSLYYGIGPICGGHMHVPHVTEETVLARYEEIRAALAAVRWEGWLPRSGVTLTETGEQETVEAQAWELEFLYDNKRYHLARCGPEAKARVLSQAQQVLRITPLLV